MTDLQEGDQPEWPPDRAGHSLRVIGADWMRRVGLCGVGLCGLCVRGVCVAVWLLGWGEGLGRAQPGSPADRPGRFEVGPARRTPEGVWRHEIQSEWQAGELSVRVLQPDPLPANRRLPVVYVLPVEAGEEDRYGDGLREIARQDLANRWQALFVAPSFAQLPWYADHPTRPDVRQESHFVCGVVPWVERTYPAQRERAGRLLLGFSKSGWGAWSLLLRHAELFERAVAWDAPLLLDHPGPYGSGEIFGTAENFAKYELLPRLKRWDRAQNEARRLILPGHANFRREHRELHRQLTDWRIPHQFTDTGPETHDWHSGWVEPAVRQLLTDLPKPAE